ncbi:MAG: helix-turn-helix domain-containing protein, partial [Bacteroidota bacterium]
TIPRKSILEHRTTVLIKHIDAAHPYVQAWLAESLASGRVVREGAGEPRLLVCRPVFALPLPPGDLSEAGRLDGSLSALLQKYTTIEIPPLNERRGDIPVLAGALLSYCVEARLGHKLTERPWSDNIDGLKAYLWNLVVASHSEAERSREREELQKMLLLVEEGRQFSLKESLARIEERIIERALARSGGRQAEAARLLGLTDRTIRRHICRRV